MFPVCRDLNIGYARPIDQRKIRPPDLQQTDPCRRKSKGAAVCGITATPYAPPK
jgi:hypothetical protein